LETDLLLVVFSELRLRRALLEPLCFAGSPVPAASLNRAMGKVPITTSREKKGPRA
jgi:hypothetical protein